MNRQNYTILDSDDEYRTGWFDLDAATVLADDELEYNSHAGHALSTATRTQLVREQLLRTAGGEHIIEHHNGGNSLAGALGATYLWCAPTEAEEWLRRQGMHDIADRAFRVEAERVPRGVGRTREGTVITVRIPDAHLSALDSAAAAAGSSRAALIRSAVAAEVQQLAE